jgi:cell division protein FtsI/penicillin-binding protein 2
MNRALQRLSLICLVMFLALMVNVNVLQVFRTGSLAAEPGNSRVFNQQLKNWRGEIIAAGGPGGQQQVIAESRMVRGGFYQRYYPSPYVFSAVTGYDSIYGLSSPFGTTGIEHTENAYLAGTSPKLAFYNLKGLFSGKPKQGASVYLTISPRAQLAAYQALAAMGRPAAAVAINPATGAILALASFPTFNPNDYTTFDSVKLGKVDKRYRNDRSQPLLNRAINATYPPGSSFKIVTSSTAFSIGKVANPNSTIPAPQFYHLPGSTHVLTNDYNSPCGNGNPQIIFAFTISCNTAFGKLGVTVGPSALYHQAGLFGFNNPNLTIPLPVSASRAVVGSPPSYPVLTDKALTALSAIGQFNDAVTPLQEAMMAATVANGGKLMTPYMVDQIRAPDQSVVYQSSPTQFGTVITPQVAAYMSTMMESVTHNPNGTAYATAGPPATSIDIRGKTGTAQNGPNNSGLDDAVFACFAAGAGQQIAVGVIVQGGGFGAAAAAPIAVKIIQAYLGQH